MLVVGAPSTSRARDPPAGSSPYGLVRAVLTRLPCWQGPAGFRLEGFDARGAIRIQRIE